MRDEVFIKDYRNTGVTWDVAHLYEHVVMNRLDKFQVSNFGLLRGANLSARTYLQLIEIRVDSYNKSAGRLIGRKIRTKSKDFDDSEILKAIVSLESEGGRKFIYDLEKLKEHFEKLEKLEWVCINDILIEEFEPIDHEKESEKKKDHFDVGQRIKRRKVLVDIAMPIRHSSSPSYQPLTVYVAEVVLKVVSRYFTSTEWGMYVDGSTGVYRNSSFMGSEQWFWDSVGQGGRLDIIKSTEKIIDSLKTDQVVKSMTKHLREQYGVSGDYRMDPVWNVFEETGYLIGLKGIKKLATPESIRDILDKLEVHVQIR